MGYLKPIGRKFNALLFFNLFCLIFFLHVQFTLFQTKSLQSPGTYISERTWDSSQKSIIK